MANLATKILDALDAAIGGPPDTNSFLRRQAERLQFTPTSDELASLKRCEDMLANISKAESPHTGPPGGRYLEALAAFERAVEAGASELPRIDPLEHVHEISNATLAITSGLRRKWQANLQAAAAPIAKRFADLLTAEAGKLADKERATLQEHGLPFAPSAALSKLRSSADDVVRLARSALKAGDAFPYLAL
jgi:hypothetical protein